MDPRPEATPGTIRLATRADLAAINAIYNHYVRTSTCTYQLVPETDEARAQWFERHGVSHPITVHEQGSIIDGWGSLSPFRPRDGLRQTVEDSIYVHHEHQRRGIGGALLSDLVARGRAAGHHAMIAGISAEQEGSIELHRRHGFVQVGLLREIGRKFDRWLDLAYWQLVL